MKFRTVRVPGKVMLTGEYAVLAGGTAVLTAVPRYLNVYEVNTPPHTQYPKTVEYALRHPIRELDDFEEQFGTPWMMIERSDFIDFDDNNHIVKLGLGSSAAEAVGVIAMRFERAGIPWKNHRSEIARHAVEAHRQTQGGKGSGADVAACALGQPISFRRVGEKYSIEVIKPSKAIKQIPMTLVWSRKPADTRVMVEQFTQWAKQDKSSKNLINPLIEASDRLAKSWFTVTQDELFEYVDKFTMLMNQVGDAAGINYKLPIHEELEAWALSHGGRAKPTGAGGGDMILLLGNLPLNRLKELVIELDIFGVIDDEQPEEQ